MEQGGEELSGLREEAEPLEVDADTGADDGIDTDSGPESVHETVAREYEKLQREAEEADAGAEGAEPEAPPVKEGEKLVRKRGRPSKADIAARQQAESQAFQIPPPSRLKLEHKEVFNQLPDGLKRATHQMFREQEAHYTQVVQKAAAAEREARGVSEAVRPYLLAHPELTAEGYTESRFVAGLVAAHQRLTDPKTQRQALAELCQQQGLRQEIVQAILQDAPAQPQQPQVANLPDEAKEAIEWMRQMRSQQVQQASQSILSELESVQNEIGPDGRYQYPKLHDGAFLEQWKPLVSALVRAIPGIGYADAGKRAYATLDPNVGNSTQVNQTRFPAQTNHIERAQRAAVSVRGRSAPSAAPGSNWIDDVPVEELGDVRQTVKLALENMRRGV